MCPFTGLPLSGGGPAPMDLVYCQVENDTVSPLWTQRVPTTSKSPLPPLPSRDVSLTCTRFLYSRLGVGR